MHLPASARAFLLTGFFCVAALAGGADAAPVFLDFDSVASGSPADDAIGPGASLHVSLGAYLPELDAYGDPIPGSDAYRPDPDAVDLARVSNPALRGYGVAPSGLNALDALDQGVLISFDQVLDISLFSVVLDLSPFGFPGGFDIVFQDASGATLLALATQQDVPGYVAAFPSLISNVSSIYLPSGAYYDDLSFDAVPVPEAGTGVLLITLAGLLGLRSRRSAARAH